MEWFWRFCDWLRGPEYSVLGIPRSGKWRAFSRKFLIQHPECAVCGSRRGVVPHHVVPVHVNPDLELEETNLITLCEPHHLLVGHLMLWASHNPKVREDAVRWRRKIIERP